MFPELIGAITSIAAALRVIAGDSLAGPNQAAVNAAIDNMDRALHRLDALTLSSLPHMPPGPGGDPSSIIR